MCLNCPLFIIVVPIFLWQDELLDGQFWAMDKIQFTTWAIAYPVYLLFISLAK